MKFSLKLINSFLKTQISLEDTTNLIQNHLTEIKEIKKVEGDYILNIEILPNRAYDLFSHFGIARELSSLYSIIKGDNIDLVSPQIESVDPFYKKDFKLVKFKNNAKHGLLRYSYLYIENLKQIKTPAEIKNTLENLGIKSINFIVDLTNYVMVELGQPLHAFDKDKISGNTLIVDFAKQSEKIKTFDDKIYTLSKNILTIRDKGKPIAIAGIKGGKNSGIDSTTKNIIIESASFDKNCIRKASFELKIDSDAEKRFKSGTYLPLTKIALERLLYLIKKYTSFDEIVFFDYINKDIRKDSHRNKIEIAPFEIKEILGTELDKGKIKEILKKFYFEVAEKNKNILVVKPPEFRNDIALKEDIIEEIFRVLDFKKIKREPLKAKILLPVVKNYYKDIKEIRDYLIANNFDEILSYSFYGKKIIEDFSGFNFNIEKKDLIEIENPISEKFVYLRNSLIPGLVSSLVLNLKFYDKIKIFETGKVYNKNTDEKFSLGLLIYTKKKDKLTRIKNIIYLKSIIKSAYKKFNNLEFEVKDKHSLDIKYRDKIVGKILVLKDNFKKKFKIIGDCMVCEIVLDDILKDKSPKIFLRKISKFPYVKRDISFLIDESVSYKDLVKNILSLDLKHLKKIYLKDIYIDKNFKNKISYTFHLEFGSDKKTIEENIAQKEFEKIEKSLKKLNALIR